MKQLGKRAAVNEALKLAAAKLEVMDLAQVFGDEIVALVDTSPGLDEILDQAQKQAVARIRSLVKT